MKIPEEEIGISVYLTEEIPGIGGRLKTQPEDFVVDEVSLLPPERKDGKLSAAIVRHRNWEMNRLIRRFSTNLRIGRNRIGFAGTKDKRSVATQIMTFPVPPEALASITIPDVEFLRIYRTRTPVRLGSLIGNRFRVILRDVKREGLDEYIGKVTSNIESLGGFPNFFGVQRFGVIRPVTHKMGRAMIMGDFEGAVDVYLSSPGELENDEAKRARQYLSETKDCGEALKKFPEDMVFEKIMLRHLSLKPGDFPGAIGRLPRNLVMMFVHAYQSYLFNRILSYRIAKKLPLDRPLEGDIILPLSKNGLPDQKRYIAVKASNLENAERQVANGLGFVSGCLFGAESELAKGEMGEIEREVVEAEGICAEDFIVPDLMTASSKGTRRELLAPFRDLEITADEEYVHFSFELNKGCYATSLLREYMKADLTAY